MLAIWSEHGLERFLLYGIEIFLVTQNIIKLCKCYAANWNGCLFSVCRVQSLYISKLLNMAFKSSTTSLFHLPDLIHCEKGRLKYLIMVVILTNFYLEEGRSIFWLYFTWHLKAYACYLVCGSYLLSLSNASLPLYLPTFVWNFSLPNITVATLLSFCCHLPGIVLSVPLFSTIPCYFGHISYIEVTYS